MASTEITKIPEYISELQKTKSFERKVNIMDNFIHCKAYNAKLGTEATPEHKGKIELYSPQDGSKTYVDSLEGFQVLTVTKRYEAYVNKLEVIDGKLIGGTEKGMYISQEMPSFYQGSIAVGLYDKGFKVLGAGDWKAFSDFTREPILKIMTDQQFKNPLNDGIGVTADGNQFNKTHMRLAYYAYGVVNGKLHKIKLGSSYGNFKNPDSGTYLAAIKEAGNMLKAQGVQYVQPFMFTLDIQTDDSAGFNKLIWLNKGLTNENVTEKVAEVISIINQSNKELFGEIEELPDFEVQLNKLYFNSSIDNILSEAEEIF